MQMSVSARDLRLDDFLRQVLAKANEFVPSESGSIFLDDPTAKFEAGSVRANAALAAVACFGPKSRQLLGKKIPGSQGIVGRVYVSGEAYYSRNVRKDPHFSGAIDKETGHQTRSILCVPISIRSSPVGVLELVNKEGKSSFSDKDFELLKIFADYISASIQNFMDAKRHEEIARRDGLTGLSNDREFHRVLRREASAAWRTKKELGLIFLDLDRFKEVNDEHGHLAGSRVLIEVAAVIRRAIRWSRADIARYGGDEYVIVLPNVELASLVEIAEDIRRAIERTVFLAEAMPDVPALKITDQVTASIGVACLLANVNANDANLLLRAADQAMYQSKRAGKNRVTVWQGIVTPHHLRYPGSGTDVTQ